MTTITVTAADTAQAMDKIVERLGDDALILETVKRNGRIEMVATNDPDEAQAPAPASGCAERTRRNGAGPAGRGSWRRLALHRPFRPADDQHHP